MTANPATALKLANGRYSCSNWCQRSSCNYAATQLPTAPPPALFKILGLWGDVSRIGERGALADMYGTDQARGDHSPSLRQ